MKDKLVPLFDIDEINRRHWDRVFQPFSGCTGIFHDPIDSPRERLEQMRGKALTFVCIKCCKRLGYRQETSGIQINTSNRRECPTCHSPLMYCPACKSLVSATEKFQITVCDKCDTDFVTDSTIDSILKQDKNSLEIVLSGIRATGRLHLGNYLGAVSRFIGYQDSGKNLCMYFIANWHTLTTLQEAGKVSANSVAIAADYLAAGLDPNRSIIYIQSSVPEIAELALYLSMIQSKSRLEDMPTLKDLVKGGFMSLGHLSYPVLMAADILGMRGTLIPVGADQIPNVELARDLAQKFNNQFGQTFIVPRASENARRIPSLGGGKMAKSESDSSIMLTDTREEITRKYKTLGVTDINKQHAGDIGDPESCQSVFPVFKVLLDSDFQALRSIHDGCKSGTRGCHECKMELVNMLDEIIAPIRERRKELDSQSKFVQEVLHYGSKKAREIIKPVIQDVREKLGMIPE